MGKLRVYNFLSLNGFYKGANNDISWAKTQDRDESEFAAKNLQKGAALIFGRITYELMVSYWPTPEGKASDPAVAAGMNKAEKIVFSRSLDRVDWDNARLARGELVDEIKKLKSGSKKDMTILGSGSIVRQLTDAGLIDEYQLMYHPVAIGEGTPLLEGTSGNLDFKVVDAKQFRSGSIFVTYGRK